MSDKITKNELSIAVAIIVLLIGAVSWFVVDVIKDAKEQNRAQWKESNRTKECMYEKINKLGERVSFMEGYHKAQQEQNNKKETGK